MKVNKTEKINRFFIIKYSPNKYYFLLYNIYFYYLLKKRDLYKEMKERDYKLKKGI